MRSHALSRSKRPPYNVHNVLGRSSALSFFATLVAGTLALGGCSNGCSGSPSSSTSPPAESAAAPADLSTLGPRASQISDALPSNPGAQAGETAAPQPTIAAREIAGASHILIAYKGAERAPKSVTRSKEEAKKRAEEARKKVKDGATFEDVVKQYTDDEISKGANGAVGNFERNAMPAAFADATFALSLGDISGVVETPQGFHIIKRTK